MIKNVFEDLKIAKSLTAPMSELDLLLTESNISSILGTALSRGGEIAEIYAEVSLINGISLEENKIRQAQSGVSQGIGIRVLHGEKTGYAYSEIFDLSDILKAAKTAAFIAESSDLSDYQPPKIETRQAFEISDIQDFLESYPRLGFKDKKQPFWEQSLEEDDADSLEIEDIMSEVDDIFMVEEIKKYFY